MSAGKTNSPLIRAMKNGDWDFLAAHIEAGGNIDTTPGLRKLLVDIVRGTASRSANRHPAIRTELRKFLVGQFAAGGRVKEAMEKFSMDRTTVQRAVQAYKQALEKNPQLIISLWLYHRGYY